MNPAYNNTTTTIQESRNRYNTLLAQALERIKARKTAQEPEEVTTTATDVTTTPTQQPEEVTSKSRRQIIEDMRRNEGHEISSYIIPLIAAMRKETGEQWNVPKYGAVIVTAEDIPWFFRYFNYLKTQPARDIEAIETEARKLRVQLEMRIKSGREFLPYRVEILDIADEYISVIIELYSAKGRKDGSISEIEMHDIIGKQIRYAIEAFDKTGDRFFGINNMGRYFRNVARICNNIKSEHNAKHPATAPQATEEDTTTAPEEVATEEATAETPVQEPEEVTTEEGATPAHEDTPATDDNITVLKYCVEKYGEIGADYLDTLDYTQATEQVYSIKRGNTARVTERYCTIDGRSIYGLYRRYNKNGKRAKFVVVKDGQIIEERTYGHNNNYYKVELKNPKDGQGYIRYQVEDGKVTRAEYLLTKDDKKPLSVVFDDTNRPATPRDLPAPATTRKTAKETISKETAKEAPATTVQEQPTSKTATAPTTEEVTAPEEVQKVTASKQEDDTTPYWLLLENELKAQQEEQEQTLATPETTKQEEPMHAPQMLKKVIEEQKKRASEGTNTMPLKTAVGMTTEVLTKEQAKKLLGDDFSDYNTYILVDGTYVVRFDRPELSNTLYIDDESKEYKEYQRGNISAVELWRNDAIRLNDPARDLDTIKRIPNCLKVLRGKNNVLEFSKYGGRHGQQIANPDEVEIYKAAAREAREAFTKRLDSYIRRYGKKIYVHSYWANR